MSQVKPWATLVSEADKTVQHQLTKDQVKIGRKNGLDIIVTKSSISNIHCIIRRSPTGTYMLEDQSTNGCFLNDLKMSKGAQMPLANGDIVWLLHPTKVKQPVGFKFTTADSPKQDPPTPKQSSAIKEDSKKVSKQDMTKMQQEEKKRQEEQKVQNEKNQKKKLEETKREEERQKLNDLAKSLKDQITCTMCLEIMFLPVACHPCNHRLCGHCLTSLVKEKKSQCINCRKEITTAQRDTAFNCIIEDYLKSHPEEKRTKQEEEEFRKNNIFGNDTVDVAELVGKKAPPAPTMPATVSGPARNRGTALRSGRAKPSRGSDMSAQSSDEQSSGPKCRECLNERRGFKCASDQRHVGCANCRKLIPIRPERNLSQQCGICEQYFCNLYYPPCKKTGNKLLNFADSVPAGTPYDASIFRNNNYEFSVFRTYLYSIGVSTLNQLHRALMEDFNRNGFKYLVDRKIMSVTGPSRQITLDKDSKVCENCWRPLWFQMVFNYRVQNAAKLPMAVSSRVDCYYGINCTTMSHKEDHARKLNHICYQTRF